MGDLPAVHRRRYSTDKREWRKLIEIQQHLLLTSSRSSRQGTSSGSSCISNSWRAGVPLLPKGQTEKPAQSYQPEVAAVLPQPCSSAPALLSEQRILLQTAEVLETLSILLQSESSASSGSHASDRSIPHRWDLRKNLKALHERTRALMNERCLAVLRRECVRQVEVARRLHDQIRSVALSAMTQMLELLELGRRPILAQDVRDGSYRQRVTVLENLRLLVRVWPVLLRCVGHTLVTQTLGSAEAPCCWHGSLDAELRMARVSLVRLSRDAARWAYRTLRCDLVLLCHADAADLRADWVAGLFASFQMLDRILSENRILQASAPLVPSILSTLAVRQAQFAAEKFSALACAEAKRMGEEETVTGRREADVLGALVQCGQSLLLQYLFAASCHAGAATDAAHGEGRAQWRRMVPQPLGMLLTSPAIEQLFWGPFWNHFSASVVRLVTQLPRQDAVTEALPLCPPLCAHRLLERLELVHGPHDLPPQATVATRQIHQSLLTRRTLATWRNGWNPLLVAAEKRQNSVTSGSWGNSVSGVLGLLAKCSATRHTKVAEGETCLAKHHLALTLHHILGWLELRKRSALHPWNPSVALQVGITDTLCIWKAVQDLRGTSQNRTRAETCASVLCADAVEALKSYKASTPWEFYSCCRSSSLEALRSALPAKKRFSCSRQLDKEKVAQLLEPVMSEVLDPALEAADSLHDPARDTCHRLSVEAFAQAWLQWVQSCSQGSIHPEWGLEILLGHLETLHLPPETLLSITDSVNSTHLQAQTQKGQRQHSGQPRRAANRIAPLRAVGGPATNSSFGLPSRQGHKHFCCI